MSCGLLKGRKNPCNDNSGGVKRVYLFNYFDYLYNEIVGTKGVELTAFPTTKIHPFECVNASFDENINNDADGVSIDQTLSFTLLNQDLLTTNQLHDLTKIDLRYVVEYNNGNYRIGGLFNGANITELKAVSGGSKNSLNGYQITIKSEEEYLAAFLDISIFIISGTLLILEDLLPLLLETSEDLTIE